MIDNRFRFVARAKLPVLGVVLGTMMTLVVQSSSATIAVLQNFASQPGADGVTSAIGLTGAIPILLGDNIGMTITALLASVGQSKDAKRTAFAHSIFNISGALLFIWFVKPYASLIQYISPKGNEVEVISRQIANAYTGFNITMTLLWLPLIGILVKIVTKIVPDTANVSHELKTPLTSISGYSELIANGMVKDEDAIRFAGEIHRNAQRLISLINDILKLSELDSNKETDLALENVDLYELASNCVVMLAPVAEKRNITFHLDGEKTIVHANKDMMEEVIYNLCDNAIRYNKDHGNIWIEVANGFSVRDDGIGISKENQDRIFERFYRVDKSRSKKTGGTGLGLAIVKHIVELHDGTIEVESELGEGTKITITL